MDQPTQLDFDLLDAPTQVEFDDFTDAPTQIDIFEDRPKRGFILRQDTVVDEPSNHQIRAKSFLMKQGTIVDSYKSPSKFLTPPKLLKR